MTPRDAKRIFSRERRAFSRYFPHVSKTKLIILDQPCVDSEHCAERDLAYAIQSPPSVTMLRRSLSLPKHNVVGLIRHELGHVADRDLGLRGSEQRADDIAEYVTGKRIFYDQQDIQTTANGKYPRPRYLHR